jgi:hypothetical protein
MSAFGGEADIPSAHLDVRCLIGVSDRTGQTLAFVYFGHQTRPAIGGQAAHERRIAKDCGEYRQAAGAALRNDAGRFRCPLSGVKQTLLQLTSMSVIDPKRTFGPEGCCHAK